MRSRSTLVGAATVVSITLISSPPFEGHYTLWRGVRKPQHSAQHFQENAVMLNGATLPHRFSARKRSSVQHDNELAWKSLVNEVTSVQSAASLAAHARHPLLRIANLGH